MPTNADRASVLQPLLERRPNLVYRRGMLFFTPLTHYARGVIFQRGWISGDLTVWSLAFQLYQGYGFIPVNGNREQVYHRYSGSFLKGTSQQFSKDLCERIERDFLPVVEPMNDPRSHEECPPYVADYASLEGPLYRSRIALGACYHGEFDEAERLLAELEGPPDFFPEGPITDEFKFHWDWTWQMVYLLHLLRTDRRRIPTLLHDWERYTVHSAELTKYWKREPFPCELA